MIKIVYWNNLPAPYIIERFNAIADRGNVEFEAWFTSRNKGRSWEVNEDAWRFKYRYLPKIKIGSLEIALPTPLIRRDKPDVLVLLYADPGSVIGWHIAWMRGVKTVFWIVKTFPSWEKRRPWREKLKTWMMSRVTAVFSPGPDAIEFSKAYGTKEHQWKILQHSIDVDHFSAAKLMPPLRVSELRQRLGTRGVVFTYVGRLILVHKGLDCLLEAFLLAQSRLDEEITLLLIGDGVDEQRLKNLATQKGYSNVLFAGFVSKSDMPEYYAASDIFVFPTIGDPYGLVVDEAMAAGLPVISTSSAGEIRQRIKNNTNGLIVPPKDSEALASAMVQLAQAKDEWASMGQYSWDFVKNRKPEKFAADFEKLCAELI